MGITGLHDTLEDVVVDQHISAFAGKRVAVDTSCWLHAAKYSCSMAPFSDVPVDEYVKFCIEKVQQLQKAGIIPVMVFDGANLPTKAHVEVERAAGREKVRKEGLEKLKQNQIKEANECFKGALDVCPVISQRLIRELKAMGIEIIVAPYEADAQVKQIQRKPCHRDAHHLWRAQVLTVEITQWLA
jgi:exonuclease-1